MAAEMAVSFAIDHLLPLLTEEATMLRGIHKGFAEIKDELESIQAFLKDADKRAASDEGSEGVKTWVKQVREVAFRIEDIIDEYMIHVGQHQQQQPLCATLIYKIAELIRTLKRRHQIASEIQDIKSCVREIKGRSDRYGFQRQQEGSSSRENFKWLPHREAALYMEDTDVVGFEAPREELIGWLVAGRAERTVVSVVAMGGQGKTTLAKKVFDNRKVIDHFDCRAWITVSESYSVEAVSESYSVEALLRDMLRQFGNERGDVSTMDRRSLIDAVRNFLKQKRYVVVFDDVWNAFFWDEIQFAVIDNKNGSRILITTRKMDVAVSSKNSSPFLEVHKLQPLTIDQSLELFYRKVFQFEFDGRCPEDLIDISHVIVKKCNGLPLAIVAISGVLSGREKNAVEWERFSQNLSKELEKNPHLNHMMKILGFSYDDLPFHLKPCFLYFGLYPEDHKVESRRIIPQWIAEGFVKEETGEIIEKVGKEYLRELVCRSLVLVSVELDEGVRVKYYHVHDVVREMILTKFKDLSFGQFIGEGDRSMSVSSRRLSVATPASDVLMRINKMSSHVRSFHFFSTNISSSYLVQGIPAKYMLLRVLDFENAVWSGVPYNIENLVHLKYLSLIGKSIDLPKSISNLQNLQTLRLCDFSQREVPKEVSKLRKLRHLLVEGMSLAQLKDGIGSMTSLQTLGYVTILHDDDTELTKELGKLRQLRVLGLMTRGKYIGRTLSSSLNGMQHLEKLSINLLIESSDLNLISPPPMLRKLHIQGFLHKLPEWVPKLQNLVKLTLQQTRSLDDPMKSLQNMPSLLSLTLYDCYIGVSLHFEGGGFQKLEELHLELMQNLKSIFIDRGALPSLKRIRLWDMPQLKMLLPPGIRRLEKLIAVDIQKVPPEFKKNFLDAIGHPEGANLFRA